MHNPLIKQTPEEIAAMESAAFEYLTPKSRAIIFCALKSLNNEIQRFQDNCDFNPASFQDVTNNTKDFHNNIKLHSCHLKSMLQECSKKGELSLFIHFSE